MRAAQEAGRHIGDTPLMSVQNRVLLVSFHASPGYPARQDLRSKAICGYQREILREAGYILIAGGQLLLLCLRERVAGARNLALIAVEDRQLKIGKDRSRVLT
jgi:hypothetical protein